MIVDDEGHVTTLTVDPGWHHRGIGTVLLLDLARAAPRARGAAPHPRGPGGQRPGPGAVPPLRLRPRRGPQELLRRDGRGRHRHVGPRHRRPPSTRRRLAHDRGPPGGGPGDRPRPGGAGASSASRPRATRPPRPSSRPTATDPVVGGLQPDRPPRRLRRGGPRDRRPGPSGASAGRPRHGALRRRAPAGGAPGSRGRGRHLRSRADRLPARRASARPRRWPSPGTCPSWPSTIWRATSSPPCSTTPVPVGSSGDATAADWPLVVALVSGGHSMIVSMEGPGRYRLLGADPGRRRRGGLRQGGPLPRPRLPGRPRHRAAPPSRGPVRLRLSPGPARRRPRPVVLRAQDGRRPGRARSTPTPPTRTSPPRSSRPSSTCSWPSSSGPRRPLGAAGLCLAGGVAANGPLRAPSGRPVRTSASPSTCPAGPCAPTTPP